MVLKSTERWEKMRMTASQQIISAAISVFKDKGFHSSSMEQVAKKAKVSKGLAYNYFKSKDDLLAAIIERRFDEAEVLMEGIDQVSGAYNKLKTLLDRLFADVDKDMALYKFYMGVFLQPDASKILNKVGKSSTKIKDQWERIFKLYVGIFTELGVAAPEMETIFFRSLTTGMVAEYIMEPKSYPLDAMKAHVLKKYKL